MKKSTKTPFMAAPDYGQSLGGFTINLLSTDLARALVFQRDVLLAEVLHHDEDLLILRGYGSNWMVHADHTYDDRSTISSKLIVGIILACTSVCYRIGAGSTGLVVMQNSATARRAEKSRAASRRSVLSGLIRLATGRNSAPP